jgi:Family of unknown function (DUF6152)
MRIKLAAISFAVAGLLAVSLPLFAHHGYASYDTDRKVTLKGTVTRWIWSNPHCLLQLDVTDDTGHVVHWVAETENPTAMSRAGWTDKSLKVGDQITLTALPVKSGAPVGRIIDVILSNGQKLPGRVNPATEVKPVDAPKY